MTILSLRKSYLLPPNITLSGNIKYELCDHNLKGSIAICHFIMPLTENGVDGVKDPLLYRDQAYFILVFSSKEFPSSPS